MDTGQIGAGDRMWMPAIAGFTIGEEPSGRGSRSFPRSNTTVDCLRRARVVLM
jgi:hypothetical protein